jgi:hypothetical protein
MDGMLEKLTLSEYPAAVYLFWLFPIGNNILC